MSVKTHKIVKNEKTRWEWGGANLLDIVSGVLIAGRRRLVIVFDCD